MAEFTHYKLTQAALRRLLNSTGDFRPRALCANGSAHAALTESLGDVDCPACWGHLRARSAAYSALRAFLFQVIQGKVFERDACVTQARHALALAEGADPAARADKSPLAGVVRHLRARAIGTGSAGGSCGVCGTTWPGNNERHTPDCVLWAAELELMGQRE